MNLHAMLLRRAAEGNPLRVALIGAGKFGSMYLAQARRTVGLHLAAVVDLDPGRARASLARTGWPPEQVSAGSLKEALREGSTFVTDDTFAVIATGGVEVVIDATGHPGAGVRHVLACCEHGKHIVMVNVEADALAGPALARRAARAGIVYSLAYGDQPALICELVDWARTCGFEVVAAGKGTRYLPRYHASTPDTVWDDFGFTREQLERGDFNPRMFNSFLDGTKSAIEMAAVANATGLTAAPEGLAFPPCGVDDLARVLRPRAEGGVLHHAGQVEVVSSLQRDGRPVPRDLRMGVYVVVAAEHEYVSHCFQDYDLVTEESGRYAALYRAFHLVGLEVGISVASVGLRGEATGTPRAFQADVVAVAKRDLAAGEALDGEGGYMVYGRLMPADASLSGGCLPAGLAGDARLVRPVPAGTVVRWSDVQVAPDEPAVRLRRELESM